MQCYRSSNRRCSEKEGVLRNFARFTGKHLCQSLFFNKVIRLRQATLSKRRLWHRCFPVNLAKFLKTTFSQNTSGRLLQDETRRRDNFKAELFSPHSDLNSLLFLRQIKQILKLFDQIFIFSPNDNPLKTMKNVFYFI